MVDKEERVVIEEALEIPRYLVEKNE